MCFQVPLGQDVIEINNRLLEVIRPYVTRLYSFGLIHNRDYQTVRFHLFFYNFFLEVLLCVIYMFVLLPSKFPHNLSVQFSLRSIFSDLIQNLNIF